MFLPATQTDIDRYERAVDSAIATCGGDLRGALKPFVEKHMAAVLEPVKAGELLRAAANAAKPSATDVARVTPEACCPHDAFEGAEAESFGHRK